MSRINSYNELLNATPQQIMEDWLDHLLELDPTLRDRSPYSFNVIFAEAIASQFWIFAQLLKQKVKDSNILTAEGTALDEIVRDRLPNGRLPGTPARASVLFSRAYALDEPLVIQKGTRVAARSEDGNLIMFQTTDDVEIPNGETTVRAEVVSEKIGEFNNVFTGDINIIISGSPGITSVTNDSPAYGGTDQEDDESLRERALNVIWSSGKATLPIIETRLNSIEEVYEAKAIPLGEGDVLIVIDADYSTVHSRVYETLYNNLALGVTCPGVLAAELRGSGNTYNVDDTTGSDIWVRARTSITSALNFNLTYLDTTGVARTAQVSIPTNVPRGYTVKANRLSGLATKIVDSNYNDTFDLDVFLGLGNYPYLWVQPELQTADVTLTITMTNTPEPGLEDNIKQSLTDCLNDYRIGEKLEYSDVVKHIYTDYSTGRAFKGIDDVKSFIITCKSNEMSGFGDYIDIENDERVRAGVVTVTTS